MIELTEFQGRVFRETFERILAERARQCHKFGAQQEKPSLPPGFIPDVGSPDLGICSEWDAKESCDVAFREGKGSWAHIAVEELAEAVGAKSEDEREEELMQLATVCIAWIEAIRAKREGLVP